MVQYYDGRAEYYEDRDLSLRRMDIAQLQGLCRDLLGGRDVLEVACGTGIWTQPAAESAKHILATDVSLTMLQMAKRRLARQNNVAFQLSDAFDLRSIEYKFTAGFAGWWLSHVDKTRMRSFLEGFHQTLAPGAIVIFMDDTQATMDKISSVDKHHNSYTMRTLKDGSKYEIIKNIFDDNSLRELLADMAHNVKVHTFDYHWLLSYNVPHRPMMR